jgi:AcrR family transcriptional regulator
MAPLPPKPSEAPVRRERNALETKKRLLDAAETEFAAKGFAGVRLREVAQAAGVQQALIHHYFTDKDGLYREVLGRALEETTEGSWAILGKVTGLSALLDAFIDMLMRFSANHAKLLAILRMEAQSADGSSVAIDLLRERTKPVFDAVHATIAQLQKDGHVRAEVRPEDLMMGILSMTLYPVQEGAFLRLVWGLDVTQDDQDARRRSILALVSEGVLPRPPR